MSGGRELSDYLLLPTHSTSGETEAQTHVGWYLPFWRRSTAGLLQEDGEAHDDKAGAGRGQGTSLPRDTSMHMSSHMDLQTQHKCASPTREVPPRSLHQSRSGVGASCVCLGSRRPGGGSQKYPRCSALGTRQEEEEEMEGVAGVPMNTIPGPLPASLLPRGQPVADREQF